VVKKRKAKTASKRSAKKVSKKAAKKLHRKSATKLHRKAAAKPAAKAAAKPAAKAAAKPAKRKVIKKAGKRRPNAAFMTPVFPDGTLAAVVGASALPRTELTRKIWDYIKRNGLQDQQNRRMINADDKLRAVFGGEQQVNMFRMTSLVNQHVMLQPGTSVPEITPAAPPSAQVSG
jgi:upstream activation factor subunit UAF30